MTTSNNEPVIVEEKPRPLDECLKLPLGELTQPELELVVEFREKKAAMEAYASAQLESIKQQLEADAAAAASAEERAREMLEAALELARSYQYAKVEV